MNDEKMTFEPLEDFDDGQSRHINVIHIYLRGY